MTPSICTSAHCSPPQKHCPQCSHAIYKGRVTVKGKVYRFEFTPMWGPMVWAKCKDDYDWTPNARHPFWNAFQMWYERNFKKGKA